MSAASEKEQIEALGKWWKENGSSIITGLLLGVSILLGGKAWFNYQDTQVQNASNIYSQMMVSSQSRMLEQARTHANELISNYTDSTYAPLAALLLARLAVQDGKLGAAQGQLQWALDHATSPQLENTARLRLVRVLIAQQQYAQAEKLLASVIDAGAYAYLYAELEGDLAAAQNQLQQAATAYKKALDASPAQAPNRGLLTAKYENISGTGVTE
ncbi:MAG TPA: tetratricopeptide repeat protein [Gammaproteobacteria bacterium]|nr:tetratricopeptide repeat protein [Gammaproteobacteria bacterium]